jgi:hypothetical protein
MKKFISYGVLASLPAMALAADLSGINSLVVQAGRIVAQLIPIMFALAIVWFFWGLVTFLRNAGDEKAQQAAKGQMIWGVVAIAVMVSIYGLVNWLRSTLGIGAETSIPLPTVPGL